MSDGMIRLTTPDSIAQAISTARRLQMPQTPLLQAARDGIIAATFFYDPGTEFPRALMRVHSRPLVVVVGDDPPCTAAASVGPEPWVMRRRLRHWMPRSAIVHATGGREQQYREIVTAALMVDRLLVVETGSAAALAWRDALLPLCPVTVLLPQDGGVHPVPESVH